MRALATDLFYLFFNPPLALFLLLGTLTWFASRLYPSRLYLKRVLAATAIFAYIGCTPAIANQLARLLESRYPSPSALDKVGANSVILVLTDGWFRRTDLGYVPHIGEAGWERLEAAVALQERGGGRLLITGAPNPGNGDSVAEAMAAMARRLGVPKEKIVLETKARNTYENIVFSKPLVPHDANTVWLVTSALHMARAMAVAEHQGLRVRAYPCDFRGDAGISWRAWIPTSHGVVAMQRSLHEIIGLLVYRLRGWA